MEKKQYEKLLEKLLKRDYKKYNQDLHREDYVLAKGFHKEDNIHEEGRTAYNINLSIYDYTLHPEYKRLLPKFCLDMVNIGVHIVVSRTVDELIELELLWDNDTTIEDIEEKAEEFYKFVCKQWPTPRKG